MHRRVIGTSRPAGAGRDALRGSTPARPALHVSTLLLLLLQTRSCAMGAEALAHQLNDVFAFLERAMSDRAGARPISIYLIIALSAGRLEPWSPRSGQGRTPKKYLSKATDTSKGLSSRSLRSSVKKILLRLPKKAQRP